MKKCPECGNPSYDGAPVCGNCGYKFPKPKVAVKRESIFEGQPRVEKKTKKEKPKVKKPSNEPSVLDVIKEKKLIIGIILLITFIVICGIFITGSHNNGSSIQSSELTDYAAGDLSFKYPGTWENLNLTDPERENAVYFDNGNNTLIEHYNVSTEAASIKEINQERLSSALLMGDDVNLLEIVTIDGRNSSNILLENANGNFTRYVSIFDNGEVYVFKITGDSLDSLKSDSINNMIDSVKIV